MIPSAGKAAKQSLRGIAVVFGLLVAGCALAQPFPGKPVKMVVPYPPGGGTDVLARIVAPGGG